MLLLGHSAVAEFVRAGLAWAFGGGLFGDLFVLDQSTGLERAHGAGFFFGSAALLELAQVGLLSLVLLLVVHLECLLDDLLVLCHVSRLGLVVLLAVVNSGGVVEFCHDRSPIKNYPLNGVFLP